MPTIEITKTAFKKMEHEWYNYHNTLKEIARLREEIMNPFDEEPDNNVGGGANSVRVPGDPTGRMATRLTTSKQLSYLTEVIEAIEKVYNALPDKHKQLVMLRYWSRNNERTWDGIALEMDKSKRQLFYWRKEIILATVELVGWR